ncbi:uncharacterized protein LOC141899046 [Tubulanus polymorphus]|uniref:uncharacterized protein LOC141899046 n=1 Tax=Tubulanus polymorphus TaxID=672921 RepID=UPI003DA3A1E3
MVIRKRQLRQFLLIVMGFWGVLFITLRLYTGPSEFIYMRDIALATTTVTFTIPKPLKPKAPFFQKLDDGKIPYCNKSVDVYNEMILVSKGAEIETRLAVGSPGGEDPTSVLNRNERDEHYTLSPGFFRMTCNQFRVKNNWRRSVLPIKRRTADETNYVNYVAGATVIVERNEYANVYWTLIDIYNVFIVLKFLEFDPGNAVILLLDGHPSGPLDPLWTTIFRSVLRVKDLKPIAKFETLIWMFDRSKSPLLKQSQQHIPLIDRFREFVLSKFGAKHAALADKCRANRTLQMTFVWRRDYLNHPRNPEKIIGRKISNEEELISTARRLHPNFVVNGVQLDALPIHEQISVIATTDILIGMHGAALAFSMFQPWGGGLIELYPMSYGSFRNWHMEYIAKWSGVLYESWQSKVMSDENIMTKSSYIPPYTVMRFVKNMTDRICSNQILRISTYSG